MPRPPRCRKIAGMPAAQAFKPVGVPMRELQEVVLRLDEFEAIRLADLDGLYQEQAAEEMNVSRTTFSRIVEAAHRKVADALVHGKALRIEGGPVHGEGRRCCRLHDDAGPVACDGEHEIQRARANRDRSATARSARKASTTGSVRRRSPRR